jgi:hypothetical protein
MVKIKIKLLIVSHNLSEFFGQRHILLYLFTNTLLKFHSMGSEIMINDTENNKQLFLFEKFVINKALFDQSLNEYLWLKRNSLPGSNFQ